MSEASTDNRISIARFRWIGYGLLLISLFDTVQIFTAPEFMNPFWEFQTIGVLVERLPVPLVGLALVFAGEEKDRGGWERVVLKPFAWLCLLIAILFLLTVPLGIVNTFRINNLNNQRIEAETQQQVAQLTNVETQVGNSSEQDLQKVASELARLGVPVQNQKPQELKQQILTRVSTAKKQASVQMEENKGKQRALLLKNAIRWSLGALIGSVLFFLTWRSTGWVERLGR